MSQVIPPAPPRRTTELLLLIVALAIGLGAHLLSAIGMDREVTSEYWVQTGVLSIMALVFHLVLRLKARYADPYILPIAVTLNGLGIAMIHRLDLESGDDAATRQLMWTVVAMAAALAVLWLLRDHRLLRRFTYLFLAAAGVFLLLPLIPGLGMTINGARIWINVGIGSFQPGEVAKILLAIFFAGYLSANRDLILLAGKKIGPVTFPRFRDMGPLIIAWGISMGVLVFQRDLGSAILFFGLFMAMIYLATSRISWIILGLLLVGVGAVIAVSSISHVGLRVEAWLNAFDPDVYNRAPGGSFQIVQGLFGLASGGLMGTGLGEGRPDIVAYANSDMIVASFGEELGFIGLAAIIMLLFLLVTRMMRAALGTRDAFGKLLAAGLAFTVALQCFVVIGGVTMVIPLTGLTTPFMAAGGSSLLANWIVVALVLLISQSARRPVVVGPMVNASGTGSGHQDRTEPQVNAASSTSTSTGGDSR